LVGLLGALALTRWLGSLLFEISPLDPLTFVLMPLLLLLMVLLASALPAERAACVDPVEALQFS
jgi:ABC-type lipoprotein release transport system permease subunit